MTPGKSVSFPTDLTLKPPPPPVDLTALAKDADGNWITYSNKYDPKSFTKVQTHLKFAVPVAGTVEKSVTDEWITPTNPAVRFTTDMLGFVADQFPNMAENYRPGSIHSSEGIAARALRVLDGTETEKDQGWQSPYWYPTVSMNVEIKKQLPQEGVVWLFVRARAKEIKDGRMDIEVLIFDAEMELVALAQHIGLIVNISWNAKQAKKDVAPGTTKL